MTEATQQVFTLEEKEGLGRDLTTFGRIIESHDESIFQLVASINALQQLLIAKGVATKEEVIEATDKEIMIIREKILAKSQEAEAEATATTGGDKESK